MRVHLRRFARTTPLPWGVDVRRNYGGPRSDQSQVIELARHGKVRVITQHYALDDGPLRSIVDGVCLAAAN